MTSSNGTLIKMQGVSKVFFTDELETHALDSIDLEIKKGEHLAIAGPSGCGKSTLLAILGLLSFVLWIVCMIKAFQGERFMVPYAGEIAANLANR